MQNSIITYANHGFVSKEQFEKIKGMIHDSQKGIVSAVNIEDINGYNFWIKYYQRGYRWNKTEIEEMLAAIEDLDESEDGYCVQPIIIKKIKSIDPQAKLATKKEEGKTIVDVAKLPESVDSEKIFELLDGQQRLTTLWMILTFLKESPYSIYYELKKDFDRYYIQKSYDTVFYWFVCSFDWNNRRPKYNKNIRLRNDKLQRVGDFEKTPEVDKLIKKIERLFFIWYEVEGNSFSKKDIENLLAENMGEIHTENGM